MPVPPGANMLASPEVPRNVEEGRAKGRAAKGMEVERGQVKHKGRSPEAPALLVPKVRLGRRGKPQPDYGLPNLTPRSLSVVNMRCSAFKASFHAGRFLL